MLGEYACGVIGGHIEEAYLAKSEMTLTYRGGGGTWGVGKRRGQDRREKGEEKRRGKGGERTYSSH